MNVLTAAVNAVAILSMVKMAFLLPMEHAMCAFVLKSKKLGDHMPHIKLTKMIFQSKLQPQLLKAISFWCNLYQDIQPRMDMISLAFISHIIAMGILHGMAILSESVGRLLKTEKAYFHQWLSEDYLMGQKKHA